MGSENSVLEGCEWDEETAADDSDLWVVKAGRLRDDTHVSLFTPNKRERRHKDLLRHLTKQLISVRHPGILRYVTSGEDMDGPYLVTEKAVPLETVLPTLSSTEISAGLYSLLEALSFLHDSAGKCHNNVCLKAVYAGHDGSWRLGGLEHACLFTDATADFLKQNRAFRCETAIAPEEKEDKLIADSEFGHARDMFSFAVMTEELLELLQDLGDMTKTFELRIQDECLNADPKQRPTAKSLLNDRLFTSEFLDIAIFLKQLALQPKDKRADFFRCLVPKLLSLPEELVGRRLVPMLLSRFVLLDQSADEFMVPHLLTPSKDTERSSIVEEEGITCLFTGPLFKKFVIPELLKIFRVHDLHIRLILLRYFSGYVSLFDVEDLECSIFPQILLGLRDTSEVLVAESLRALAELVPILGRSVVIGGQSKTYFKEGTPKDCVPAPEPKNHVNNKLSSVTGMLGKVLLKDLAKLSNSSHYSSEEKERKLREREKRNEEARQKREQRRLQMKEQKPKGGMKLKSSPESPRNEETAAESKLELKAVGRVTDSERKGPITTQKAGEEANDWSDENDDSFENDLHQPDWLTGGENAEEKGDWSDWDGEEERWASDDSEEVSPGQQALDMAGSVDVEHSIESQNSSPRVQLSEGENSRNSLSKHSQGALQLKSGKSKQKTPDSVVPVYGGAESSASDLFPWGSDAGGVKPSTGAGSTKPGDKVKMTSHNQVLGAEFDIKSLEMKVEKSASDPFDFFADMTPAIKTTASIPYGGQVVDVDGPEPIVIEDNKPAISFAVVQDQQITEDEENDGAGWDNEDW